MFAYTVNTEKLDPEGKKKKKGKKSNISSKSRVWFGPKAPKPNSYLVA